MEHYGFGEIGKPKMEEKPKEKPVMKSGEGEADGDEGVTVHVHKKGGKYHSKVDKHDGFPPDEMDHDSADEAHAEMAKALEEKYGEGPTEEAEEKVAPGVHEKAGNYLEKARGMMEK